MFISVWVVGDYGSYSLVAVEPYHRLRSTDDFMIYVVLLFWVTTHSQCGFIGDSVCCSVLFLDPRGLWVTKLLCFLLQCLPYDFN